ncbi:MAG: substrate-binding domain-containing protein [Actinomycetota bacterium]
MARSVPVIGHIVHCNKAAPHRWELAIIEALSRQTMSADALPVVITDVEVDPPDEVKQALRRGIVDALAVTSFSCRTPWVDELVRSGMPVVMVGPHPTANLPFVAIDGRAAIETLIQHLAGEGRRRIGLIAARSQRGDMTSRIDGWRRGLADAQLLQDDDLVVEGDFTPESGATAALQLWERQADAIIAVTDPMARGAIIALERAGVGVPKDVAVAGIDGAGPLDGRLTTVCQPFDLIAETIIAELLVQLEGGDPSPETLLLGDLSIGTSTVAGAHARN